MSTSADPIATPNSKPGIGAWPLFGLTILSVASIFLYGPLLSIPSIRSTAWPVLLVMGAAAVLSVWMVRKPARRTARLMAGVNVALPLLFGGAFFGLQTLPAVASRLNSSASDFTLPDQEQRPVSLTAALAQGPVLLVFYRGHW